METQVMKHIVLSMLTLVGLSSPALAMSHNGAPGASWLQMVWMEIECLFETSLFVLGLIANGEWFMLANLDGICTTLTNSVFFSDPLIAVATAVVMMVLTLTLTFLSLRWLMQQFTATRSSTPIAA